jgi:hypothetical protein
MQMIRWNRDLPTRTVFDPDSASARRPIDPDELTQQPAVLQAHERPFFQRERPDRVHAYPASRPRT